MQCSYQHMVDWSPSLFGSYLCPAWFGQEFAIEYVQCLDNESRAFNSIFRRPGRSILWRLPQDRKIQQTVVQGSHATRTYVTVSPPPSRALFVCALFRRRDTCASKCPATVERTLRSRCGTIVMWSWAGCTTLRLAEFRMYRHRGRGMPSSSQPESRAR